MTNEIHERITIRTFSPTFEKMCNFIAVARTGDPQATVCGLVTLCLLDFPDKHLDSAEPFRNTIETLFGLAIPDAQIGAALDELERNGVIFRPGNSNYRLEPAAMESLKQTIEASQGLENRIKEKWFQELATAYPSLKADEAWQVLRVYLSRTFRRHGIQATALLDPSVDTPAEHEASLTSILHESVDEHNFSDIRLREDTKGAISDFMALIGTDPDRSRYIAQLADGAFNFYTLEIPTDLSDQLRQQLHELTLFLDTNFLFGILDLHYNTQVQVSHDLLRAISAHSLPFKLRYHEATQKEMANTIAHYGSLLRSHAWSQSLSRAAASCQNLTGIEQKFHERNSCGLIDVNEFLRPYEHFDLLLAEKDIKVFRPHAERTDLQNDLFHEYQSFLEKNGRSDKAYETVMHDAKILEQALHVRTNASSSLKAGALVISCDYYLYRFDWETSRKNGRRACVLLPNIFWQILRPFIPHDQNFEKAFAETFALPEFRAIGSGGSKACSKMLQILASYKEVPEQTAMKMLANDLLLDRLRSEQDDVKFAAQVEAAFVEENRNLIEEKAALDRELKRQKGLAEEESRKRQEELIEFEIQKKKFSTAIEEARQLLEAAEHKTEEHDKSAKEASNRARDAVQLASEAQKKADQEAKKKSKAERDAFLMRVIAGAAIGTAALVSFLALAHMLPWGWLISHKNTVPLQIGISATFMCSSIGLFVRSWRKWCWGVGCLTFFVMILSLMGKSV
ncbi:MAG: cell envelope integrity protein TolA [Deltaproteobacteria bacterium]|nr:cell envelope integrity protein TolA [Deltaproteobacteria bacterium]